MPKPKAVTFFIGLGLAILSKVAAAQCPYCDADTDAAGGNIGCVTVTASATVIREGECDEDELGACYNNTATDVSCRFQYNLDISVVEPPACGWEFKLESCGIDRAGVRFPGCPSSQSSGSGNLDGGGQLDLNCGSEMRATVYKGGQQVGFVKLLCKGCLPGTV